MKIYLGGDHAGFELKEKVKEFLKQEGYKVEDCGAYEFDKDDDYPDFIRPVAEAVVNDKGSMGIILGKSGQGEAMCANRVPRARAGVFYSEALALDPNSEDSFEMIKLLREHNDANILSLSSHFLSEDQIKFAVELFLKTEFKNEERYTRRIKKLG